MHTDRQELISYDERLFSAGDGQIRPLCHFIESASVYFYTESMLKGQLLKNQVELNLCQF